MAWLLSRDALIAAAFSLSKSSLATAIPIFLTSSYSDSDFDLVSLLCLGYEHETKQHSGNCLQTRHLQRVLSTVFRTLSVLDFRWRFLASVCHPSSLSVCSSLLLNYFFLIYLTMDKYHVMFYADFNCTNSLIYIVRFRSQNQFVLKHYRSSFFFFLE